MKAYNIFHFEDDNSDAAKVKSAITMAWRVLQDSKHEALADFEESFEGFESEIVYNHVKDIDGALKVLDKDGGKYQLAVLDLLDANEFNAGHMLVQHFRTRNLPIGIIGFSGVEQTKYFAGERKIFEGAARLNDAGPYHTHGAAFFSKHDLSRGNITIAELAQTILKVSADVGLIQPQSPTVELDYKCDGTAEFYALEDIKGQIGEQRLKEIVFKKDRKLKKANLHYMTPGLSGAFVLRLKTDEQDFLFKVSNTRERLQKELDSYPKIGEPLAADYLHYESKLISSYDKKWHGMFGTFFKGNTIRSFLLKAESSDAIPSLLQTIFLDKLGNVYQYTMNSANEKDFFEVAKPNTSRMARVLAATKLFEKLATKHGGKEPFNTEVIEGLFPEEGEPTASLYKAIKKNVRKAPYTCFCHGDLHGRNIMVDRNGGQFRFIDPDHNGPAFWPDDTTKFMVDIFITGLDHGKSSEHEWDDVATWRGYAQNLIRWKELDLPKASKAPNLGVQTTIHWFQENIGKIYLDQIIDHTPGWEFQMALGFSFLRAAYREELPTPKRVLALLAGHDAMVAAEQNLLAMHN